jgi:hypothetical protein
MCQGEGVSGIKKITLPLSKIYLIQLARKVIPEPEPVYSSPPLTPQHLIGCVTLYKIFVLATHIPNITPIGYAKISGSIRPRITL